ELRRSSSFGDGGHPAGPHVPPCPEHRGHGWGSGRGSRASGGNPGERAKGSDGPSQGSPLRTPCEESQVTNIYDSGLFRLVVSYVDAIIGYHKSRFTIFV